MREIRFENPDYFSLSPELQKKVGEIVNYFVKKVFPRKWNINDITPSEVVRLRDISSQVLQANNESQDADLGMGAENDIEYRFFYDLFGIDVHDTYALKDKEKLIADIKFAREKSIKP